MNSARKRHTRLGDSLPTELIVCTYRRSGRFSNVGSQLLPTTACISAHARCWISWCLAIAKKMSSIDTNYKSKWNWTIWYFAHNKVCPVILDVRIDVCTKFLLSRNGVTRISWITKSSKLTQVASDLTKSIPDLGKRFSSSNRFERVRMGSKNLRYWRTSNRTSRPVQRTARTLDRT